MPWRRDCIIMTGTSVHMRCLLSTSAPQHLSASEAGRQEFAMPDRPSSSGNNMRIYTPHIPALCTFASKAASDRHVALSCSSRQSSHARAHTSLAWLQRPGSARQQLLGSLLQVFSRHGPAALLQRALGGPVVLLCSSHHQTRPCSVLAWGRLYWQRSSGPAFRQP